MNLTLSVDDEVVQQARRRAGSHGQECQSVGARVSSATGWQTDLEALAAEFRELTRNAKGNSRGWKFNREEIHERR